MAVATRRQIKDMADRLISTLDALMPSEKADAIVGDVAEELYHDVLGVPGRIVADGSKPTGHMHIGGSRGVKKQHLAITSYKFQEDHNE